MYQLRRDEMEFVWQGKFPIIFSLRTLQGKTWKGCFQLNKWSILILSKLLKSITQLNCFLSSSRNSSSISLFLCSTFCIPSSYCFLFSSQEQSVMWTSSCIYVPNKMWRGSLSLSLFLLFLSEDLYIRLWLLCGQAADLASLQQTFLVASNLPPRRCYWKLLNGELKVALLPLF